MLSHSSFRIARSDDRALITAVLHRYAALAREDADWSAIAELFTVDAQFRLQDGTTFARDEISGVVRGEEAAIIRHHVTTVDITFLSDDEAHTETFYVAITDEAGPDHWGTWHDVFRRQADGTWSIAERLVTADGADPDGWLMRIYTQTPP
ncbi:nuclear transport factor 2 family protein [Nocardia vinacea]|uniref:Nuclear transport factor 2 family protein n=1 Tax=Nocardia vinacea TaxID=96468 RepID=A0ABZ1YUH0_9NOCA|nr:nuclear transport factor 2 family protein [Nocardia vinacea]